MSKPNNLLARQNLYVRKLDIIILGFLFFLFLVVIYLFLSLLAKEQVVWNNWFIAITFIPIIIISVFLIISEVLKRKLSLNLMHIIFIFIFLGLAPLVQYLTNSLPWASLHSIEDKDVVLVNIFIIIWILFYILGYYTKKTSSKSLGSKLFNVIFRRQVNYKGFFLLLFFSVLAFLYLWKLGAFNLWTRAAYESIYPENHSLLLIVMIFVRAIPILALAVSMLFLIKGPKKLWLILTTAALVILNIFLNNPLAAPRYWTATILIGFAVIILSGKLKNPLGKLKIGIFLTFCIIVGLLVILPLINIGRYYASIRGAIGAIKIVKPVNILQSGDFSNYANSIYTMHYIEEKSITWGRQLTGSLLFFVPRVMWTNKPVDSGNIVAAYFDFPNLNTALPFFAEGMINFGIIGIPIFALVFGRTLRIIDNSFVQRLRKLASDFYPIEFIEVIYPFWLGLVFFISRGGLISSWAYTVGFTIAGLPLILLSNKKYHDKDT